MDDPVSGSDLSQLCLRTPSVWHIRKISHFIKMSIEAPKIGSIICVAPLPQHADSNIYLFLYHCKLILYVQGTQLIE